jgi:hypothetical protein
MYVCLFHRGTFHVCVCSIVAHYAIMKKWKWVFVNCYETRAVFLLQLNFLKCAKMGQMHYCAGGLC